MSRNEGGYADGVQYQSDAQMCRVSVLDSTFPGIEFDSAGVALPAADFVQRVKPAWLRQESEDIKLRNEIRRIKKAGESNEFDSILGLSGGLDSSYMLHLAVTEWGLRPLVFHVDAGWNTEQAVRNITSLVDKLGIDLFTEVIDWGKVRDFQLAFFRAGVPHLDIPQDHAFIATLYNYAEKFEIRTILNGGNLSTEGLRNPLKYFYYGTDMRHIRDILARHCEGSIDGFPFSSVLRHKAYLRYARQIRVVKPLNLVRFRKREAEKRLEDEYGWKPYRQKHFESRFTAFYEGYWLPQRFGFDPRTVQLSSLVLTDQMDRTDALEVLSEPALSREESSREFQYVADKLEIPNKELELLFEMSQRFFFDYKNSASMFNLGARVMGLLGSEETVKR